MKFLHKFCCDDANCIYFVLHFSSFWFKEIVSWRTIWTHIRYVLLTFLIGSLKCNSATATITIMFSTNSADVVRALQSFEQSAFSSIHWWSCEIWLNLQQFILHWSFLHINFLWFTDQLGCEVLYFTFSNVWAQEFFRGKLF